VGVTNTDNEPVNQGSIGAPMNLTTSLPFTGSVASNGAISYYYVNGLTPSATYFIALSSLINPARLDVYQNAAFTTLTCTGNQNSTDSRPKSCFGVANASGEFYITVSTAGGTTTGSKFKIDIVIPPANEGTSGAPIALTYGALPYIDGQVGTGTGAGNANGFSSFYVITGVPGSVNKLVRATNLTTNVDLFVYSNSAFSTSLCSSSASTIAEACLAAIPAGGTIYVQVTCNSCGAGSTYTLDIVPPSASQGAAGAPVDITGQLPYSGSMLSPGSFYMVSGLTPSTTYTAALTEVTGGGSLEVYSDVNFTTQLCSSNGGVNLPESCQAAANASGKLYIKAATAGLTVPANGTTFNVRVE
jgi:hypothetical protein